MATLLNWEVMRPHAKPENPVLSKRICLWLLVWASLAVRADESSEDAGPAQCKPMIRVSQVSHIPTVTLRIQIWHTHLMYHACLLAGSTHHGLALSDAAGFCKMPMRPTNMHACQLCHAAGGPVDLHSSEFESD